MIYSKSFTWRKVTPLLLVSLALNVCSESELGLTEEIRIIETYSFSDANPIPILTKDSRLYPYHSIDDYSHENEPRNWKIIKLENDHIEVTVLPEVGGKVWGAVDKSNGEEFIYRNEVMKFRNIALRGPWTSGGIEFNFGIIGHTPSTATPVDYTTKQNEDGSVSVIVGAMDLPSRTHWRVEVRLEAGRSSFETRALWYNPTPNVHPYYNWMTAAAFARDDLEIFFPGNQYLKHSGEVKPWPTDAEGRDLSFYDNNRFEGHKSYHVVGDYLDFFGGYYHDSGTGFGHWAPYEEMPGQKLWLWAISNQGGIWEDLLTDSDGQYIEFQAGRQFVQFSPSDHFNPIKKASFEPYAVDSWREVWFPLKGTGGMDEASSRAAMKVGIEGGEINLKINAFVKTDATVTIDAAGQTIFEKRDLFVPGELKTFNVRGVGNSPFQVIIPELALSYNSNPKSSKLQRPFATEPDMLSSIPRESRVVNEGMDAVKERRYGKAKELFQAVLKDHSNHPGALKGMIDLYFRSGQYEEGLTVVRKLLQLNTYDPEINFMAGNLYRANGYMTDAKESFGWAARSLTYRSAAYTQMSEIALIEHDFMMAKSYAEKALKFNSENISALEVLALLARMRGEKRIAETNFSTLLNIDPLNHFAHLEMWFLEPTRNNWEMFENGIINEFAHQTVLELAIGYHNRGLTSEAIEILHRSKWTEQKAVLKMWLAYLQDDATQLSAVAEMTPHFVFPYRRETLPVLRWSYEENNNWRFSYFLSLNLWSKERKKEAVELMNSLGNTPDYGPFYIARGSLRKSMNSAGTGSDFERSVELSPELWQAWLTVIDHFHEMGDWEAAYNYSSRAVEQFTSNFNVEIAHARSLLFTGRHDQAAAILETAKVLPSEHSRSSRQLYEWAYLQMGIDQMRDGNYGAALKILTSSRKWPENLGLGRPYDSDERLQDFLSAICYSRLGQNGDAETAMESILTFTRQQPVGKILRDYITVMALQYQGEREEADSLLHKLKSTNSAEAEWIRTGNNDRTEFQRNFEFKLITQALRLFDDS